MEVLLANVVNQENLAFIVKMMIALFAKDFVVAFLRKLSKRLLSDKDPRNDAVGEAAEAAADVLDKVKFPGVKK